jgi:serine/threonine-protein kinase RsbW
MGETETSATLRPKLRVHKAQPAPRGEIAFEEEIASDMALVHSLVLRAVESLRTAGFLPLREEGRMALCIEEALVNAVVHGNKGDRKRKVRLQIFRAGGELSIVVSDEGKGFDPGKVEDPRRSDSVWRENGRGIFLIRHYMDNVEFFANGSAVLMRRRL